MANPEMNLNRQQIIDSYLATYEQFKRKSRAEYSSFVKFTKDDYIMKWFHRDVCNRLDAFERGEIKKMMMFLPPQHGKSELSTRRFIPYLAGKKPSRKIALVSYNATMAENFNRAVQRVMDSAGYLELFPDAKLNNSKFHSIQEQDKKRTTEELEILGKSGGSIKTIGRGGALTGNPVDIGIIDDPIKDREEAMSHAIREYLYNWYVDVFCTRLHNDSQQLIVLTRWDENDLAGRILKKEPGEWVVITYPAIRTNDVNDYDPRLPGEALWPEKHSVERIMKVKEKNPATFNSLYQQDPKPNDEILVFSDWISIPTLPKGLGQPSWGLDFGKTTGTNALVKCWISPETHTSLVKRNGLWVTVTRHKVFLQECLYAKGVPVSEIENALWQNGYEQGQIVWADHMPIKINEMRNHGISAIPAIKGPGSVGAGIDKMNEYQVYYIGANIKMETGKYQYTVYDDIITSVPVDDWNHIIDASRYGVLSKYFREQGYNE